MENIMEVVQERDRAVNLLETGETGDPGRRWAINPLGVGYWRRCTEHYVPLYRNATLRKRAALHGSWQDEYLRLYREKYLKRVRHQQYKHYRYLKKLKEAFPEAEVD